MWFIAVVAASEFEPAFATSSITCPTPPAVSPPVASCPAPALTASPAPLFVAVTAISSMAAPAASVAPAVAASVAPAAVASAAAVAVASPAAFAPNLPIKFLATAPIAIDKPIMPTILPSLEPINFLMPFLTFLPSLLKNFIFVLFSSYLILWIRSTTASS